MFTTNLRQAQGLQQNSICPRQNRMYFHVFSCFHENTARLAMSTGWQGAASVTVLQGQLLLLESHVYGLAPELQEHDRKY